MKLIRNLPKNYKSSDINIFPNLGKEITLENPGINKYKNVLTAGFNLFSINSIKFLNKHSMVIDFNLGLVNFSKHMFKYVLKNNKIKHNSIYIWAINDHCFNYYHWTAEALPRLLLLKKESINEKVLIPLTWKDKNFIFDSLKILGFDYMLYNVNNLNLFSQIISPNHLGSTGNFNPEYMNIVRNSLKSDTSKNRKFWILRHQHQKRYLNCNDDFKKLLKKYKIETIYTDNLEYSDEIKLFSQASFIGGLHGAGLVNMIFMDKNSNVFEIKTKEVEKSNAFYSLADALGHNYYYLKTNLNETRSGISLDLDLLEIELSTIFKN